MQVTGTSRAHVVTSAGHVLATLRVHIATRFSRPSSAYSPRLPASSQFLFTIFLLYSTPQSSLPPNRLVLPQCTHSPTTMSDPELSMAAASSSPSLPAADSNALTYAFLVHSQKTLTQNLPPRVDNKLLARQKRRRTRYVFFFFFIGASDGPSRVVRHQKLTITTHA